MSNEQQKKQKKFKDAVAKVYLRKVKKWMFCPACRDGRMTMEKKAAVWTCPDCGYSLSADEFEDDFVFWFCDECNSYLNVQEGFNRKAVRHVCRVCGYENDTSFGNVKGICSDCGATIPNADLTLCAECKSARRERAKSWLEAAGAVAAAAGAVCAVSQNVGGEGNDRPDEAGNRGVRCANCGNADRNTLWDEGDTIYCSKCAHRTCVSSGEDDMVECPYCHRMRDRKALYCRWCNDSTWVPSTPEEFEEADKILKAMGH